MRLLTVCTAVALLAALAGEAAAKEVVGVTACGPSDCRSTRDRDVITLVENGGTPSIGAAASKSDWYRLRTTIRIEGQHDEHFTIAFIPSKRLLRMGDVASGYAWTLLSRADVSTLQGLVRGIEPFPAAKLDGVPPVDETPASTPAAAGSDSSGSGGGASPLPWIGGALLLAGGLLALVLRRRRPRPAS
jgi:hypothetical protein